MKTTFTKFFTFILLLGGMFSFTVADAQCICSCTNGPPKLHAECYTKPNGTEGCRGTGRRPCARLAGEQSAATFNLFVYPNPVSNATTVSFYVDVTENISVKIFDVSGRLVTALADATFEEGDYELIWNAVGVNSGIYFLRMETANYSENQKLLVAK